jgi:hypothetical protein
MSAVSKGSCLCGEVSFEVSGEFENFFLCHCKYCQKDTGSAHAANIFSTKAKLNWLNGEEKVKTYTLNPTKHTKSFCSDCGSALPSLQMQGKLVVVPAGSLDQDISIRPSAHLFVASKACWDKGLTDIREFVGLPEV